MGGLLTGLFATPEVNPTIKGGAFYGHGMQFVYQLVANSVAAAYVFSATLIILVILKYTVGLRINEEKEAHGIDISYHGGLAYDYSHHGDQSDHGPKTVQFKPPEMSFEAAFMKADPAEQV
ncbi:hypothetical protein F443_03373 [Phytophthora nicotianae P1569]|nr:hypothetical protein F443_03373 [Phytophthora nicotianae P1569]